MSLRRIAAVTLTLIVILVFVTAVVWTYLIASYESELGTSNVIEVDFSESESDSAMDNQIASLSFDSGAEDLSWSSVEINLEVDEESYGCSFGSQSVSQKESSAVTSNLGADGKTFTTQVDATDSESYTYIDLAEQQEGDQSSYWMKFSSTDIYLSEGVSWAFVEGVDFSDVEEVPEDLSNQTDERLEWYEYDMSVHRVIPNDGVYVLQKSDLSLKVKILSYYNSDDESRYPTMLVAAIGNSTFPALSNPDLVVPSACKIISDDLDSDFWNANETIILAENGIDFCNGKCILVIDIKYETITVEMDVYEIEIGQ